MCFDGCMILGYCCINLSIKSKFKNTTQKWLFANPDLAEDKLLSIYNHNLSELIRVLDWNMSNNIKLYRISSDVIPFADHIKFQYLWQTFKIAAHPVQLKVKEYLDWGGRLCIHPSQYVSLGSSNPNTRDNSIRTLEYHGELLNYLGCPSDYNCPINIHLSNGRNIKDAVPFIQDCLGVLSDSVMSRLVFENEDCGNWRWQNIMRYFSNFPVTLDFHHWKINNSGEKISDVVNKCVDTWGKFDPIFHHSEGKEHPYDRSHSDFIQKLPTEYYNGYLELEAKKKDLAVLKFN